MRRNKLIMLGAMALSGVLLFTTPVMAAETSVKTESELLMDGETSATGMVTPLMRGTYLNPGIAEGYDLANGYVVLHNELTTVTTNTSGISITK